MATVDDESILLNNTEAAKYLGVSPGMLRLSRHTGELFKGVPAPKFMKLGNAVRYPRPNLELWVRSQSQFRNNAEASS